MTALDDYFLLVIAYRLARLRGEPLGGVLVARRGAYQRLDETTRADVTDKISEEGCFQVRAARDAE